MPTSSVHAEHSRYRSLLDAMDDAYCTAEVLFDESGRAVDHRIVEANPAFERHTGVSNPVGKLASELVPGGEQRWNDMFGRVARSRIPERIEDGSDVMRRWFDVSVTPIGKPGEHQVAIFFRDVSARRDAEQALQQRRSQFETLLNEAPLGMFLVDADFHIRAVNPAALPAFAGMADLVGRDFVDVMHTRWSPERAEEFVQRFRDTLETGERFESADAADVDYSPDVTEYYAWQINRIALPEGGHGVVCYFRDIAVEVEARTRRLASEQARLRTQQELLFVMDSMPQKIWTADPHGVIDYLNPQWTQFTGLSGDDVRDWSRKGFIHEDDLASTLAAWQLGFATGTAIQIEHRFRRSDGEYRWHVSRCLPMRDADGSIVEWVGSSTDIHTQKLSSTDMERASEVLAVADVRKDEFLAILAHELRNPLAPIRNALQILQLTNSTAESVAIATGIIDRQTAQMIRLVDELLDVSRISRGTIELRSQSIRLDAIIAHAVETSRPAIESAGHELVVIQPERPVFLLGDMVRLVQVFGNLLNNAGKFTERGGRIELRVVREADEVIVTVSDSGIGIPSHKLLSVFEMFQQVDSTLDRSRGGLGIGLSLVQRLVELHQGTVVASSAGPHLGSVFTVRLPVQAEAVPTASAVDAARVIAGASSRRVLVVDDNEDSANSLVMYLQLTGHDARAVYNGLDALDAAESFRPELILLDIGLPGMDGLSAAQRIRESAWGRQIRLVALSGWGQSEDRRRSLEAGFDMHLVKPIDHGTLSQLLSGIGPLQ